MTELADDPQMTLLDAQRELGCARLTLLRWIKAGRLPAKKSWQGWLVRRSVIEKMKRERAVDGLLSLREVTGELSVAHITLLRWIKDGKIVAKKINGDWYISMDAVAAKKEERGLE